MKPLYLENNYLKEFEAEVVSVKDDNLIVLDNTCFYPQGGGQPSDAGVMLKDTKEFNVIFVNKIDGMINHEVDKPGLKEGDKVACRINWDKRYKFMRMHTAAHLLSAIINKHTNALITGGQLGLNESRIDLSIDDFDKERIKEYISEANNLIEKDAVVKAYYITRDEAEKDKQVARLAKGLPEGVSEIRIVEIQGIDRQADGGTHVRTLKEISRIELLKCENKGRNNRRIYYTVK